MTIQDDLIQQLMTQLQSEFVEVRRLLTSATDELQAPLGDLVRGQLQRVLSPRRAGVILAAGLGQADSPRLREQRILVAAALELLYLALEIHRLLPSSATSDDEQAVQKFRIGSVILAGDYCFSRSAILAAQTDEPEVVETFARGLKVVSENHLRQLFQNEMIRADEDNELVQAGLSSAAILAGLDPLFVVVLSDLGKRLLQPGSTTEQILSLIEQLPDVQQVRWRALLTWQPLLAEPSQYR